MSPDQTIGFIEAVGALGLRDIWDIRRSALALFAIPKEREVEFDALFRALFFGQTIAAAAESSEDEDVEVFEATVTERLGHHDLQGGRNEDALGHFFPTCVGTPASPALPPTRSFEARRRPRHAKNTATGGPQ